MLDYYGNFPPPSFEDRKRSLAATTVKKYGYLSIYSILLDTVVKTTDVGSLTAYIMFVKYDLVKKLTHLCEIYKQKIIYYWKYTLNCIKFISKLKYKYFKNKC